MVDASWSAPSRSAGTINKKQLTPLAARLSEHNLAWANSLVFLYLSRSKT